MKTTTIAIASAKLAKSKINKTSIAYANALKAINGEKQIRPVYTSGSGKFISNQDHTITTIEALKVCGIECILSNDSKRGGLTGNLLTITTKLK